VGFVGEGLTCGVAALQWQRHVGLHMPSHTAEQNLISNATTLLWKSDVQGNERNLKREKQLESGLEIA